MLHRVLLGCLLIAASWNASAKSIDCTGCKATDRIYKAKGAGPGIHYIYDLATGESTKVTVTQEYEEGVPYLSTWFETPEQPAIQYFMRVAAGSANPLYTINGDQYPGNGWELAEFPQLQGNVGTYIKDTGVGYANDFATYVNAVGGLVGLSTNISMTVKVIMPDGSTALYQYNNTTQSWKLVPDSIKDSDGNSVPQSLDAVAGGADSTTEYVFTNQENWMHFTVRVVDLGASLTGNVTVGPTIRVSCHQTSSGVVCTAQ